MVLAVKSTNGVMEKTSHKLCNEDARDEKTHSKCKKHIGTVF